MVCRRSLRRDDGHKQTKWEGPRLPYPENDIGQQSHPCKADLTSSSPGVPTTPLATVKQNALVWFWVFEDTSPDWQGSREYGRSLGVAAYGVVFRPSYENSGRGHPGPRVLGMLPAMVFDTVTGAQLLLSKSHLRSGKEPAGFLGKPGGYY